MIVSVKMNKTANEENQLHTLSYATLFIDITLFTPLNFAAVSATDLALPPATRAVTGPPNLRAAVIALSDEFCKLPSRCSRIARVLKQ